MQRFLHSLARKKAVLGETPPFKGKIRTLKPIKVLLTGFWVFACSTEDTALPQECSEEAFESVSQGLFAALEEDAGKWSCTQCHTTGINPGIWKQESACQTLQCFLDDDLIDFSQIPDSEIILLIHQAEPLGQITTELSTMRSKDEIARIKQESETFQRWIQYASTCFETACSVESRSYEKGCGPNIDWGKCDPDEGLKRFESKALGVLEFNCGGCHSAAGAQAEEFPQAPRFLFDDPKAGPQLTLKWIMEKPYINIEALEESRLLTRPLEENTTVQTSLGKITGQWHGGGDRFVLVEGEIQPQEDWQALLGWVEDWKDCF
jgi:hypothetical protein